MRSRLRPGPALVGCPTKSFSKATLHLLDWSELRSRQHDSSRRCPVATMSRSAGSPGIRGGTRVTLPVHQRRLSHASMGSPRLDACLDSAIHPTSPVRAVLGMAQGARAPVPTC